jgi:RND family efflux transporter MFP subunit
MAVIMAALASLSATAGQPADRPTCAGLAAAGSAIVEQVIDGDTVMLRGGRQVRLVGTQAPKLPLGRPGFAKWPLADEARARLDEMRAQLELEEIAERNAREQLDIALRDLRRARTLNRRGTLSDAALDERRLAASQKRLAHAQRVSNVKALKARIAQQEATLKRLEWALKRARKNLGDTVLTAPFSGTASAVAFETGQQVGPADRLLTVVSSEPPEIRFALSERQYGALRSAGEKLEGRKVRVIWKTASGPLEIAATGRRVAPEVAAGKGVVHLYAVPDDPRKARWLKSGTFVEVKLPGPLERDAALLPEQAVYDGARVYAVVEGRLRALPVRLVGHAGDRAVVAGLGGGEKVVVNRMADPVEGRKAKVLP